MHGKEKIIDFVWRRFETELLARNILKCDIAGVELHENCIGIELYD